MRDYRRIQQASASRTIKHEKRYVLVGKDDSGISFNPEILLELTEASQMYAWGNMNAKTSMVDGGPGISCIPEILLDLTKAFQMPAGEILTRKTSNQ